MEFVDLARYAKVIGPRIPPFSELRKSRPLHLDEQLNTVPDEAELVQALAQRGAKVAHIRKLTLKSQFSNRSDFPRRVIVEITSRCNFSCRMCPRQDLRRPMMDMPVSTFKRVVDEIDAHGVDGTWLYHLGEPILHREFGACVRFISQKRNLGQIWLSTNGQAFSGDRMRIVLDSNIGYLNYSAHAVTEETYRTVAQGTFSTVTENLMRFIDLKGSGIPKRPFLHVQMIEQETTAHEVDAFIARYHDLVEVVSINMLEYVRFESNQFGLQQRHREPLARCKRIDRGDCFVCSNGEVTVCDVAYNGQILLGNVNDASLHSIWNSPARQRLVELNRQRRLAENEICSRCTDYDL